MTSCPFHHQSSRPSSQVSMAPLLSPSTPSWSDLSLIDGPFESSPTETREHRRVTIDILPEDVLLEIFDFYVEPACYENSEKTWCSLVQVCRKWRSIVFGSPLRLNLQLSCNPTTPVRKMLDIWPPLPIAIKEVPWIWLSGSSVVNIIAALEHNDRVCAINLCGVTSSQAGEILAAMQKPFPALTSLLLEAQDGTAVNPDSFLGGSSPRLQDLTLSHITFPGLPKLLLSATRLTSLRLFNIPYKGHISAKAMVTCLFVLTRLEMFLVEFDPRFYVVKERLRPPGPLSTRALLPALTWLQFKGTDEYVEDIVAWINAPLLNYLDITFFHQLIFDTPQLAQFISRTPKLQAHNEVQLIFYDSIIYVTIPRLSNEEKEKGFKLEISCDWRNWRSSLTAQVCTSTFSRASNPSVEHLYLCVYCTYEDHIKDYRWLELLYPFTSVKNLYLSRDIVPHIAPALQELVDERVIGVLPALQTIFLEKLQPSGPVQEAIDKFIAARKLSGQPIAVSQLAGVLY